MTGLQRRTRLAPGRPPKRAQAPVSRPRRTGATTDTTALVIARDGGSCVPQITCRGLWVPRLVFGHRVNRAMGGSRLPWINLPSNAVACCDTCNHALEDDARPDWYAAGWKVRHGVTHPRDVPVRYPDGSWWLLDDNGGREAA